jgi:hypothetical protein
MQMKGKEVHNKMVVIVSFFLWRSEVNGVNWMDCLEQWDKLREKSEEWVWCEDNCQAGEVSVNVRQPQNATVVLGPWKLKPENTVFCDLHQEYLVLLEWI